MQSFKTGSILQTNNSLVKRSPLNPKKQGVVYPVDKCKNKLQQQFLKTAEYNCQN